jgi:hypothetical protein
LKRADLERRVDRLTAVCEEFVTEPAEGKFALIGCDRCGRSVRIELEDGRVMLAGIEGWGQGPEGDLCPSCMERRQCR